MADHLKRAGDTGHLMHGPGGHLVRHCDWQVLMCFTDEATPYTTGGGTATYDADLAAYRAVIWSVRKAGCLVPTTSGASAEELVLPADRSTPAEISLEKVARSPSQAELTSEFDRIRAGVTPQNLIISIDVSGSMTRSTIEPGIDDFEAWVATQYPDTVVTERTFTSEQWVDELGDALVAVFDL